MTATESSKFQRSGSGTSETHGFSRMESVIGVRADVARGRSGLESDPQPTFRSGGFMEALDLH